MSNFVFWSERDPLHHNFYYNDISVAPVAEYYFIILLNKTYELYEYFKQKII